MYIKNFIYKDINMRNKEHNSSRVDRSRDFVDTFFPDERIRKLGSAFRNEVVEILQRHQPRQPEHSAKDSAKNSSPDPS